MNCEETLKEAYLFLDGEELDSDRRREIEAHLEECAPCLERFGLDQEVTAIIARLRGCSQHVCPDELRLRITTLIQNF